jgi:DnaJ-class molecular chaperone
MSVKIKSLLFYDRLAVHAEATSLELRAAFRRAALLLHPDKGVGTEREYQLMYDAYQTLRYPHTRAAYDRFGVNYRTHPGLSAFLVDRTGSDVRVPPLTLTLPEVCQGVRKTVEFTRVGVHGSERVAIEVVFPVGESTPYTVTVPGGGNKRKLDLLAGDVQVLFEMQDDPCFSRFGTCDLIYRVDVPFATAFGGGTLRCAHPSGEEFSLYSSQFAQGAWYKLNQWGMNRNGALYVETRVQMPLPTTLTQKSRILAILNCTTPESSTDGSTPFTLDPLDTDPTVV